MKILVTGSGGFIGKNLVAALEAIRDGKKASGILPRDLTILPYDIESDPALLDEYCRIADVIVHLAGVNRPQDPEEFMRGNFGFTSQLLDALRAQGNGCPVILSSSAHANQDNPYGRSKKAGEELLAAYGEETGAPVMIYRFPNVFGKWCRPNYNSAVATFCYNIARGIPVSVNDRNTKLTLVYIDDVVAELLCAIAGKPTGWDDTLCYVKTSFVVTLGGIVDRLYAFRDGREILQVPETDNAFGSRLYATYLSYLPEDGFAYPLQTHRDDRGSFTELLRTPDRGQVSVNISKPGITKGNHWHNTKNEKFIVVRGTGVIRLRRPDSDRVLEYFVSGDDMRAVDIPPGYTHSIENTGDTDMVTLMWCSECFDPERPDTVALEV